MRRPSARWLYAVLALVLVAGVLSQLRIRTPSRPVAPIDSIGSLRERGHLNVIFVLIDTLRADHLGVYGYHRDTSPTIDELARFGVRFARARAQSSWTKASLASLWLARYPAATGVTRFSHAIGDGATLPAEVFRAAGHRTGGIYRNGWVAANFGFAQGFELYLRPTPRQLPPGAVQRAQRHGGFQLPGTDLDATEAALEFMRSHAHRPFFLYVHYMDVHQYLYEEHHALFGTGYVDAYDNAIRWTDTNVAMLVAELDALGLADETLLVIASDHGEAFGEHGLEGHAKDVYAEVIDVPLIFSLPFRLAEPVVVEGLVRNVDVFPTVFDLLGLPAQAGVDGMSLVPAIVAAGTGAPTDGLEPAEATAHLDQTWGRMGAPERPLVGREQDGLRLVYPAAAPQEAELYDTHSDPREQHDVARARPEALATLTARARDYLATPVGVDRRDVEVSEMQLNQLRALGYVLDGEGPGRREAPAAADAATGAEPHPAP